MSHRKKRLEHRFSGPPSQYLTYLSYYPPECHRWCLHSNRQHQHQQVFPRNPEFTVDLSHRVEAALPHRTRHLCEITHQRRMNELPELQQKPENELLDILIIRITVVLWAPAVTHHWIQLWCNHEIFKQLHTEGLVTQHRSLFMDHTWKGGIWKWVCWGKFSHSLQKSLQSDAEITERCQTYSGSSSVSAICHQLFMWFSAGFIHTLNQAADAVSTV